MIVADVEGGEVKRLNRLSAPQTEQVTGIDLTAQNRRVVRDFADHFGRNPTHAQTAVFIDVVFRASPELDLDGPFRPSNLPRISEVQPSVREFDLPTVADRLVENAELVADAVTERGHFQRGQGVEVTRSQAPEAAIAEAGLLFVIDQIFETDIDFRQRLLHGLVNSEIDEIGRELRAHQKLG